MEKRHVHKEIPSEERKFRLADFIRLNWEKYAEHPTEPIRPEQYKAVNAIRVCRTAALGVDTYVCPECGEVSEIYHSCKNRFCPTCSWRDTMLWAERVKKRMLNIPHRHVVMTLPHILNPLIKRNGKELLNVLMKTSAETMKDWIESKYSLKAGIISVLHTFGEKKNYHVHVHMIVTWGGIHKSTGELVEIQSPYVRVSFLQKKFREKFRESLNFLYEHGMLKHDFRNEEEFAELLARKTSQDYEREKRFRQQKLAELNARYSEVDMLFERTYEDNVSGKLSDERFMKLSQRYDEEQQSLKKEIAELESICDKEDSRVYSKNQFLKAVRKFMQMKTLTPTMLHELVERIDVYHIQGTGKNRTQRLVIHYKFVGVLDLPQSPVLPENVVLNSRQGVEIEYLVGKAG